MTSIKRLKEDHEGEWLAIAYSDYGTEGPSEGDLIPHSRDEVTVWEAVKDDPRKIYVTYAGPLIDDDMAIALRCASTQAPGRLSFPWRSTGTIGLAR